MKRLKKVKILPLFTLFVLAIVFSCTGCFNNETEESAGITIAVTIAPQKEMAEKIGGEYVNVLLIVPSGESPHTYAPPPNLFVKLENADIYAKMGSGVEFEIEWADKLIDMNPQMKVMDCSKGVELMRSGEAGEGAFDPHIWLSPVNAITISENICNALVSFDAEHKEYYQNNFNAYRNELLKLDADIRASFGSGDKKPFMVYHPALFYFAEEYGLEMLTVEQEGKEPSPAELARLIDKAKEAGVKVVFVSPQFDSRSAKTVADEIGAEVINVDPLAENYLENMKEIAQKIKEAVSK